ncbi:MAG: diguanylate cyclase [Rhodoferax sp.]|nr:diguanylate cyclase [Rhodoferax sp.]MDP3650759.1 diguanylate cyclase [Rhodoferax sp.]
MTGRQTGSFKENHILARLSPVTMEHLRPKLEWVWVASGEVLHESGKKQEFAYFPTTCVIALTHVTENDESTMVAMVGCEGLVGVAQVLGDGCLPIRSLAQTSGRAWRIKSQDFKRAFLSDDLLMEQCLSYTQLLMAHMAQLVLCNRHHMVEQQLCRWLLFSLDRLSSNSIECTQEMVSALLGVRRQGVAEAAARLEADGIIDRRRGLITVLHRNLLEQRSCECYRAVKREQDRLFTRFLPGPATQVERRSSDNGDPNLLQRSKRLEMALMGSNLAWWDLYFLMGQSVVHHSQRWYAMLGFDQEQTDSSTLTWEDRIHPDDAPTRAAAMQDYLAGKVDMFESEHRVRHKAGHWVWFVERGKAVQHDSAGQPLRIVGTSMDISARKATELTLTTIANTDFLTGIASRRHFFESAAREFARALRYTLPLSILALDLDHFKHINDTHGHASGDQVLKSAVQTVGKFLRMTDLFGRIGGEEFCMLLPNTDLEGASVLAQRILQAVRLTPVSLETGLASYSVSIGVSHLQEGILSFDALLKSADQALYRAKSMGRDRAELAPV